MPRHEPERTCIVTRAAGSPDNLLRFVQGPDGQVVFDVRNKLPGRGAWVTASAEAVAQAARKRLFSRAFKGEAGVPPDLAVQVEEALKRDLLGSLSLAVKAGAAVTGFTRVEAACASGGVAALIHAAEATPDGRRKLAGALRRGHADPISTLPVFDDLSGDDLDMAFSRTHVIHAALLAGAGSEGCVIRWRRLRRYRGVGNDAGPLDVIEQATDAEGPGGPPGGQD